MSQRGGVLVSFVDQALLSLANLLVGIFLIKHTGKADYGLYTVACSAILYLVGVQNALITTQMTVIAPQWRGAKLERFCGALATGQYLIFLPVFVVALLLTYLSREAGIIGMLQARIGYAVAFSSLGALLREFFRALFFMRLSPRAVLLLDGVYLAAMSVGLIVMARISPDSLAQTAVLVLGFASALSGLLAWRFSRLAPGASFHEIKSALAESWVNGRWALAGVTVTWLQDQSYIYLLSLMASAADTAGASAARLFLSPVALLNASFARVLMPRWASLYHDGETNRIKQMVRKMSWLLSLTILGYLLALLLVQDLAIKLFLTREYSDVAGLIILWGGLFILQSVRSNYSWALQVFHEFRTITLANALSAVLVVFLGVVMIGKYGAAGSIMSQIAGELVLMELLRRAFVRAE